MVVPLALFIVLASYIPSVAGGKTYIHTITWIDSAGINFTTYLDGLSMIFGSTYYWSRKFSHSLFHILFI